MKRVGILGDIGSGKSYVAERFGYPVFNADIEVSKLYKKDKKTFKKLKKVLPKYFTKFPINKLEVTNAILANKGNIRKIVKIVHLEIRKKMNVFLKKNKNQKMVILDIPLLLENKINKKNDILIFVKSSKKHIFNKLKARKNFNIDLLKRFKKIQLSLDYKMNKSQFIINNDFTQRTVMKYIKIILKKINI